MSSTPALVRVSAIMISPASRSMPRQYVIGVPVLSPSILELRLCLRLNGGFADPHLYRQFFGPATDRAPEIGAASR
jgi:hypothetical protein